MLTMANPSSVSQDLAKSTKASTALKAKKVSKKTVKPESKEASTSKADILPEAVHTNGNGVTPSPKKTQEAEKNGASASLKLKKRKPTNGLGTFSKASGRPAKKQKMVVVDASELNGMDYITHNLQLILNAQAANDNSLLVPCLLKTTKFVRDKLIPKLDSKSAESLLLSIFDILPSQAQFFKTLKQWIQGLLDTHGPAIAKVPFAQTLIDV